MNTTLKIETTDLGTWVECRSCGACAYAPKKLLHRHRRCVTPSAQHDANEVYVGTAEAKAELAKPVAKTDAELKAFAANVRRTGLTKGRDEDVLEAVRRGFLSESDAMNADD